MIIRTLLVLASLFVNGCAGLRELPHVTTNELARNISDNAANINEAQSRATSAIILKNILRSRDRWPTSYSTISGVTSNPQMVFKAGTTLDPLGLGNAPLPFSKTNMTLNYDNTAAATYKVNPFSEQGGGKNIFDPVPYELFKKYWGSWPSDVLIMMFFASVQIGDQKYYNDMDNYPVQNQNSEGANFLKIVAPLMGSKCEKFLEINNVSHKI
ncbi:MAG: hypothetical protein AAFW68_11480, partial [Pseudomonadota bacterium]